MFNLVQKVLDLVPPEVLQRILDRVGTESDEDVIARLIRVGELPRSAMGIKAKHELDQESDGRIVIEQERREKLTKLVELVQEAENRAGTAKHN